MQAYTTGNENMRVISIYSREPLAMYPLPCQQRESQRWEVGD